jgi:hypothetical protein
MVCFSVPHGILFYTYSKRNGTNTLHAITPPLPDTRLYTPPRHTLPPILYPPLLCLTFPLARPAPSPIPSHGINCPAFPYTTVYFKPLKMELTHGSETSANYKLTPGKIPKRTYTIFKSRRMLEIEKLKCVCARHLYHIRDELTKGLIDIWGFDCSEYDGLGIQNYSLYSFGSFFYHCLFGCMFCILLFNSVSYEFLLLYLCIYIVMYVMFCIVCFHRANWHSSATLTEVFPCFFLSCKENARV